MCQLILYILSYLHVQGLYTYKSQNLYTHMSATLSASAQAFMA